MLKFHRTSKMLLKYSNVADLQSKGNDPIASFSDQGLARIPVFDNAEQASLKDQLPTYLLKVSNLDDAYMIHYIGGKQMQVHSLDGLQLLRKFC